MAYKDYTTAVNDGSLFVWFPDDLATADRFNQNIKFLNDNIGELKLMVENSISISNDIIGDNLTTIKELIVDVEQNLAIIGTKVSIDTYTTKTAKIDASIVTLNSLINGLDSTYATDAQLALAVSNSNSENLAARIVINNALTALANNTYTKAESNTALDLKVDNTDFIDRTASVNSQLEVLTNLIADLDSTYATDTDIASKISAITSAWASSDGDLQDAMTALINDRYTKLESDTALALKVNNSTYNTRVSQVDTQIQAINTLIGNLDTTYVTDEALLGKISTINTAWANADTALKNLLQAQIDDRYTKTQVDTSLLLKANVSNTYDRFTIDTSLASKFDKDGGTIRGSIIPDVADTYTLGSPEKPFKDLYVGAHSLYVDGQQAFTSELGTITISADIDQNVQLKTLGSGDIEFFPSGNGAIQMKGSVQVPSDKVIMTNDGSNNRFAAGIELNGDVLGADNLYDKSGTEAQVGLGVAAVRGGVNVEFDTLAKVAAKINAINDLLLSDDVNLDTVQEIINSIKENSGLFDSLSNSKISKTSIVNNLTSTDITSVLSGYQGMLLKNSITGLENTLAVDDVQFNTLQKIVDAVKTNSENTTAGTLKIGSTVIFG